MSPSAPMPADPAGAGSARGAVRPDAPAPPARRARTPGTVGSALAHRDFRILYLGALGSSLGSWMQNVVLGPFAYRLSHQSGSFLGLIGLAQLGPVLALSAVAGVLANRVPRRSFLVVMALEQAAAALWLAHLSGRSAPSHAAVLLAVAAGGVGTALFAPVMQTVTPELVPREDLPGVVALNSSAINGSRVLGPLIVIALHLRPRAVFVVNAVSFLLVIAVVARVAITPVPPDQRVHGWRQVSAGVDELRRNRIVRTCIGVLFVYSLVSLVYVPQFAAIAERLFGIDSTTTRYRILYAAWGSGALLGALSMGTVFSAFDKARLPPRFLAGFAVCMVAYSSLHALVPACIVGFVLGFTYFGLTTALMTTLQQELTAATRGPVLGLWMMAFGGTVGVSGLIGGWALDHVMGARTLLRIGAAAAVGLAWWARSLATPAPPAKPPARAGAGLSPPVGTST